MLKLFRVTVIVVIVAAVLPVGGGMAAADSNVPDVVQSKDIGADYSMEASITGITIASVPSMNGSGVTREGYISATAKLTITRKPPAPPDVTEIKHVTTGNLKLWANVGCQSELDSQGVNLQYQPSFASSFGGLDLGALMALIGAPAPAPGFTDVGLAPTQTQNQSINGYVLPGKMVDLILGEKDFPLPSPVDPSKKWMDVSQPLVISVQDFHLVRNCAGPVFVRLHARATMGTAELDSSGHDTQVDTVDVYSGILPL